MMMWWQNENRYFQSPKNDWRLTIFAFYTFVVRYFDNTQCDCYTDHSHSSCRRTHFEIVQSEKFTFFCCAAVKYCHSSGLVTSLCLLLHSNLLTIPSENFSFFLFFIYEMCTASYDCYFVWVFFVGAQFCIAAIPVTRSGDIERVQLWMNLCERYSRGKLFQPSHFSQSKSLHFLSLKIFVNGTVVSFDIFLLINITSIWTPIHVDKHSAFTLVPIVKLCAAHVENCVCVLYTALIISHSVYHKWTSNNNLSFAFSCLPSKSYIFAMTVLFWFCVCPNKRFMNMKINS